MKKFLALFLLLFSFASHADLKLTNLENTLWRVGSVTDGLFWEYRFDKLSDDGKMTAHGYHGFYGETRRGGVFSSTVRLIEHRDGSHSIVLISDYDGSKGESFFLHEDTNHLCTHKTKKDICMKQVLDYTEFKN